MVKEYKIKPCEVQKLDINTFLPIGEKETVYCIYKKVFPFPNKSIFSWDPIGSSFKSEKEAKEFLRKAVQI